MKTYEVLISFKNGLTSTMQIEEGVIKSNKNIHNLVFKTENKNEVAYIDVALWNNYTNQYFYDRTYDYRLEPFKGTFKRVEITYTYDSENTEVLRCYVGKSNGIIPSYLEIKRKDSTGGSALLPKCITNIREV